MIQVSNDYKTAITEPRRIDAKINVGNDVVTSEEINQISRNVYNSLFKTCMKQVIVDSNIPIAKDEVIEPQFGLYVNEAFEYVPLGKYTTIEEPQMNKDTNSYEIKAYDRMVEAMVPYELTTDDITFPCNVKTLLTAIFTKLGWNTTGIPTSFVNSTSIIQEDVYSNTNVTYRDVLDEISQITGSIICANNDNDVELKYIENIGTYTEVEGSNITIPSNDDVNDVEFELLGQTSQDGTPSPSNPVPINVVSGDNDIKVLGKNLVNIPTNTRTLTNWYYYDTPTDIKITSDMVGKPYSFSYDIDIASITSSATSYTTYGVVGRGTQRNAMTNQIKTTSFSSTIGSHNIKVENITIQEGWVGQYIVVRFLGCSQKVTATYTYSNIQMEQNSSATTYEPYTSQNHLISLGVENLCPTQVNAWEQGGINTNDGSNTSSTTRLRTIDYYPINNDTNYHISVQNSNYCFLNILLYDSSKNFVGQYYNINNNINGATSLQINIPSSSMPNVSYMRIVLRNTDNTSTIFSSEIAIIKPQIELGNKKSSFTPYGTTPIELGEIGNYQDYIRKSSGKNMFDKDNANTIAGYIDTGNVIRSYATNYLIYLKVQSNTTYTLKKNVYTSGGITIGYTQATPTIGSSVRNKTAFANTNIATFTTPNDITYLVAFIYNDADNSGGKTLQQILDSIQIELGSSATTYEPYGTNWYLHKEIGKVVLDGSEDSWRSEGGGAPYTLDVSNLYKNDDLDTLMSNYYVGTHWNANWNDYSYLVSPNKANVSTPRIKFKNGDVSGLANFKTWLSTHNTIVYYVLAIPTNTIIEDETLLEQLNALEKMKLYDGVTNISIMANDLGNVKIKYLSEMDGINEDYMSNNNVSVNNLVFFNSLVFSRAENSDNIYRQDEDSVEENGIHELKLKDLQILSMNWRENFIEELWEYVRRFNYYSCDLDTIGVTYLEPLDRYKLSIFDDSYPTIVLNDELVINQALKERINADEPKESETDYRYADTTDKRINQTYLIVDKQNQQISALTSQVEADSEKVSNLQITTDAIQTNVTETTNNLSNQLNTLQSSTSLQINAINTQLENGVERVSNSLVTIDSNGINTSKENETFNTQITNKTFEVHDGQKEIAFLGYDPNVNKSVARITELEARKITAGNHRCEAITRNGSKRTAWYYIGGGN